jgi:hypothetical protein
VWYLPAVDEIEEVVTSKYVDPDNIVKPTYARFLEFQEKYYWASQPAYIRNRARYNVVIQRNGAYYIDDANRARSTSVTFDGSTYSPAPSGGTGWHHGIYVYNDWFTMKSTYYDEEGDVLGGENLLTWTYAAGNEARTDKARVRCIRKMN